MRSAYLIGLFLTLFATQLFALDRTLIAESPEDVTPLLNGQTIPNVTLRTATGAPVSLQAMIMQKPTIILFYRGGWCPYCSRQLAELKDIEQPLVDLGYQILAISPESPTRLQEQKLETEFAVQLLSDESLQAIKGFGIGFYVPAETKSRYKEKNNIVLTEDADSERAVLPAPSVFITDKTGLIKFNYVNPNFKVRPSAELLLQAAKLSL
ncbi:peroxiredoxin-like family protein [Aliiglaciecola sp. 2_MG-2023]|uniref:peroxiredoxin-like family protein n=1 Tax=unclassified Aliiglaciecola TaxID=2593648 RepID=UPI0026E27CF3|nr:MULTISPECIES: peroxiredoxin-like family protein [unclassified Aliiglaciecola]MDO6712917.1 peroxiredoxin-like family protein [Aliiglaciecola sp. 2_MG-2023]MDO6752847.1 peroxiredoxin-like family protein [Aliiglaciecola sp. 1_MG-2023]